MDDITHAAIKHLIANEHQDTNILTVTFRCPNTGREIQADAVLESRDTVGNSVRDATKREVSWGIFRVVANAVSSMLGGGVAGSMAGNITGDVVSEQVSSRGNYVYTTHEKQVAAVEAFRSVIDQFTLDSATHHWVMRDS